MRPLRLRRACSLSGAKRYGYSRAAPDPNAKQGVGYQAYTKVVLLHKYCSPIRFQELIPWSCVFWHVTTRVESINGTEETSTSWARTFWLSVFLKPLKSWALVIMTYVNVSTTSDQINANIWRYSPTWTQVTFNCTPWLRRLQRLHCLQST